LIQARAEVPELTRLAKTAHNWEAEILACYRCGFASYGPTEDVNLGIETVRPTGRGFSLLRELSPPTSTRPWRRMADLSCRTNQKLSTMLRRRRGSKGDHHERSAAAMIMARSFDLSAQDRRQIQPLYSTPTR
jgi:hypothetical protein